MEVRNLIKPSGTVVQITEIHKGDVYKRLQDSPYSDTKIVFGCIVDVLNNGEEASLVALEFTPLAYGSEMNAVTKVFTGKSEVALFPATIDEYRMALGDAITEQHKVIETAKRDLDRKNNLLDQMVTAQRIELTEAAVLEIHA